MGDLGYRVNGGSDCSTASEFSRGKDVPQIDHAPAREAGAVGAGGMRFSVMDGGHDFPAMGQSLPFIY